MTSLRYHLLVYDVLVVKTGSGFAPMLGIGIDEAKMDGVVGTLAGDDAVFIAVSTVRKSSQIKREILTQFRKVGSPR